MSSPALPDPVRLVGGGVLLGGRPVLRDVDLRVGPGDFVTVMGANGSGKSTLIRAVTGLLPLSRGELRLFGVPSADFTERYRIGLVPQNSVQLGGVPSSVREVVASGLVGRRPLLRRLNRERRDTVREALETVDLTSKSSDTTSHLSGGQRQRMLIARALVGRPDLLVLDEPTAGVDLPHQQTLAATLAMLKGRGVTILMVAHELGPLAPLVDRAVVMRDGRVVHDGRPLSAEDVHARHGEPHLDLPISPGLIGASPFDRLTDTEEGLQ